MSTGWIISGVAALAIGAALPSHLGNHLQGHFQGHGSPSVHFMNQDAHAQLLAEMNLTLDQMAAMHRTLLDYHLAFAKLHGDAAMTVEQKAGAATAIWSKAEGEVARILSPDQLATLKGRGGLDHMLASPFEHMHQVFSQLDLTPSQRQTITQVTDQTFAAMGRLMADKQLTDEQKNAKAGALHEAAMKRIHQTLTPAQLQSLAKLMQNRQGGSSH